MLVPSIDVEGTSNFLPFNVDLDENRRREPVREARTCCASTRMRRIS
jgi:hypothetical protein